MLRETFDCYVLFEKHLEAFAKATNFAEFCEEANKQYLKDYAGGWVERAFETMKAGKKTYRGLLFPRAAKFSDLFAKAYFIPTDTKQKPGGCHFLGGNAGFSKHMGGRRGWSERTPNTRSHYGCKFYGTYVVPIPEIARLVRYEAGMSYSFEATRREDGILITANRSDCIGSTWIALLDLFENIENLFDAETQAFIAAERQAEIDVWGRPQAG